MSKYAFEAVYECIEKKSPYLDLGKCELNDNSFKADSQLYRILLQCEHIEILILSNDFIDWYPDSQLWKSREKRRDSANNNLSTIPDLISNFKKLRVLMCGGESTKLWKIKNLSGIDRLSELETLILAFNEIESITELANLRKLKFLNISFNKLSELSPLEHLDKLVVLNIGNNLIRDITSISKIKNLKALYIGHNDIIDIRPTSSLSQLEEFYCDENNIKSLEPIQKCMSLARISAAHNKINDLDPLQYLNNIRYLNLTNNEIQNIKPLLNSITKHIFVGTNPNYQIIKGIFVGNNPLNSPPIEIVERGNNAIVKFFEELEIQGEDELYEAKLIIIGEGGAGKTTLARKLINDNATMPKEHETTRGIDIFRYSFPLTTSQVKKNFYLNIWDFGGQEIYHATHQFFLTRRSLYILLDDTRKDDKTMNDPVFNYWLQVCELFGGQDSSLLIVQNEKDDRSKDIDLAAMKSRFDNLKELYRTNLLTNRGLKELNRGIEFYSTTLPLVGQKLPKQWVIIREELSKLAQNKEYITSMDFFDLCKNHQIQERIRALSLSSYLHDLGVFLHFQNDPLLKNIIILQNIWATDAVYKVLDSEKIKEAKGRFSLLDLSSIWTESKYADMQDELLALMIKFELCYKLTDTPSQTFLAPQMLPVTQPKYDWPDIGNLQLWYEYTFMPKGLLGRLMVRLHYLVEDHKLSWLNGVILQRGDAHAEIKISPDRLLLQLRVYGNGKRELITIIKEEIDKLNDSYPGLKEKNRVKKRIPCNCSQCSQSPTPNFYILENLERRIALKKTDIECEISYETVNALQLLEEIFLPVNMEEANAYLVNKSKKIFFSYSHLDEDVKQRLEVHLAPLKRLGLIDIWNDRKISPGEEWDITIKKELEEADIVLLLISADFNNSEYIWHEELNKAISYHNLGKKKVIPIFAKECDFKGMPYEKLQGVPRDCRFICQAEEKEKLYAEVSKEIRRIISE